MARRRLQIAALLAAAALLSVACSSDGGTPPAQPAPAVSPASAEATAADLRLAEALVAFARAPGPETLSALPTPDEGVWLGLGEQLYVRRPVDTLTDPASWRIEVETFRGVPGPFSALDRLRDAQRLQLHVGAHPHCTAPPRVAPAEVRDLRRVSVQPARAGGCRRWWTVDAFVTPAGEVAAVTLDRWASEEP